MSIQNKMKNVWLSVGVLLPLTSFSQNVLKLDVNQIQVEKYSASTIQANSNQIIKLENQIISLTPSLSLSAITQEKLPKLKNIEPYSLGAVLTVNNKHISYSEKDLLIQTEDEWYKVESFNSNIFGNIRHIAKNSKTSIFVFTDSKVILFDVTKSVVVKTINMPSGVTNGNIISNDGIIVMSNKGQSYTFDRANLKFSKFSKSEIEDISMVSSHKYVLVEKKYDKNSFNISLKSIKKGVISSEKQIGDSYEKKPLLSTSNGRIWVAVENKLEMLNLDENRNDLCFQFTREIKSIQNVEGSIELIFSDGGKFGMRTNSDNSEIISIVSDDSQKSAGLKNRFIFDTDGFFLVRSDKNSSVLNKRAGFVFDQFDIENPVLTQISFFLINQKCSWCQVVGAVYDRSGYEISTISDFTSSSALLPINPQSQVPTQCFISPLGALNV